MGGPVAQVVERTADNREALGSNPSGPINYYFCTYFRQLIFLIKISTFKNNFSAYFKYI